MSRHIILALIAALAAAPQVAAGESDLTCTRELRPQAPLLRASVAAIFASTASDPSSEPLGDEATPHLSSVEVVLARIGPDGKPILACVDSETAALRFLEAQASRLRGRAQEK